MTTFTIHWWIIFFTLLACFVISLGQTPTAQVTAQVTPQVHVVVIVLTDTNQLPIVLRAITNAVPTAVIYKPHPKVVALEAEIKLMERRFKETYDGYPDTYAAPFTPEGSAQLDRLINIWAWKAKDAATIKAKKDELDKWTR